MFSHSLMDGLYVLGIVGFDCLLCAHKIWDLQILFPLIFLILERNADLTDTALSL
jgi:hypothetical protein